MQQLQCTECNFLSSFKLTRCLWHSSILHKKRQSKLSKIVLYVYINYYIELNIFENILSKMNTKSILSLYICTFKCYIVCTFVLRKLKNYLFKVLIRWYLLPENVYDQSTFFTTIFRHWYKNKLNTFFAQNLICRHCQFFKIFILLY